MPVRAAVWDLGSSSFHLLLCEAGPGGSLHPVLRRRALLNLGMSVGASGDIPPERVTAALSAARRLRAQLGSAGADVVVALATAALRDATNGPDVVRRLERAIGVPVRVLDGEEEARLCFVGQRAGVWMPEGDSMGVDLGGGSLELAVGWGRPGGRIVVATSVPIGPTRLKGELSTGDVLSSSDRSSIRERTSGCLDDVKRHLSRFSGVTERCVLSGGTARALARIATSSIRRPPEASSADVNQVELAAPQIGELAFQLARMPLADRRALAGMPPRRAPVLPLGATILECLALELGIERYVVSEWGLREGALLDALSRA
ncbi:MAG TPA: hypothetical protein VEJ87_09090 [Acidimicrobiales bacterium]|nr:hypothetical protein [Acidimicrobiales bacterium]